MILISTYVLLLICLFAITDFLKNRFHLDSNNSRKIVHVASCITVCTFPYTLSNVEIYLICFILTIIGLSVSSFKRRGGTGSNLAIGVSLGFLFIFLDKIFSVLVIKSNFSPAIASWGILLIFLMIAIFLLKKAIR